MLFSYDIFDTIIFRNVPKSTDVFILVEDQLEETWNTSSFGSFADMRKNTEFWLRRISKKEISIEDIYKCIQKKTLLSDESIRKLQMIELGKEKECSLFNAPILQEIKQRIAKDEHVVLISDMYWHEQQIRKWLSEMDAVFRDIPIYISCDYGVTKASGDLYRCVKEKERANYDAWIHTGDNHKSDGTAARKLGIQSVLTKGGRKYDFEKDIDIREDSIRKTYCVITDTITYSNGEAYDLGASVSAPMVYQYIKWVIGEAITKNINTLYFVLRDGYILKKAADIIIQQKRLNIKTAYIFGSRVAWRFPEITVEKLKNLSIWEKSNWIFRDPAITYVPLERLGFSRTQVDELFGTDFGEKELHSFADFKAMLDECLHNEQFIKQLKKNITEARQLLDLYFRQTIDFNESFALVDTNSTGKTQADLDSMFARIHPGCGRLRFFYHTFLSDDAPNENTQFVFLRSKKADRRFPEAFFRAPYNPCYGYRMKEGTIVPRFHESDKCAWNYSFDYDSYLQGILEFIRRVEDVNVDNYVNLLLRVVNFDVVSKDEICQVARMPFNPDLNGDEILDFYPELKLSALIHPFSQLVYYPKGSYYHAGRSWILIYKILNQFVKLKRMKK